MISSSHGARLCLSSRSAFSGGLELLFGGEKEHNVDVSKPEAGEGEVRFRHYRALHYTKHTLEYIHYTTLHCTTGHYPGALLQPLASQLDLQPGSLLRLRLEVETGGRCFSFFCSPVTELH